ncbi:hypothetical protein AAE478_000747 [Parahypoxylon ruwenzoriense]
MEAYDSLPHPFDTNSLRGGHFEGLAVIDEMNRQNNDQIHAQYISLPFQIENTYENKGDPRDNTVPIFAPDDMYYIEAMYPMGPLNTGFPESSAHQLGYTMSSWEDWLSQDPYLSAPPPAPTADCLFSSCSSAWPAGPSLETISQPTSAAPRRNQSTNGDSERCSDEASMRCWEHGCNGRRFSTRGNLVRHQKEKANREVKAYTSKCFICGAVFTRSTARDKHIINQRCGRIRRYSNGRIRPLFARSMGLSDATSSGNAESHGPNNSSVETELPPNDQMHKSPEWLELARR